MQNTIPSYLNILYHKNDILEDRGAITVSRRNPLEELNEPERAPMKEFWRSKKTERGAARREVTTADSGIHLETELTQKPFTNKQKCVIIEIANCVP